MDLLGNGVGVIGACSEIADQRDWTDWWMSAGKYSRRTIIMSGLRCPALEPRDLSKETKGFVVVGGGGGGGGSSGGGSGGGGGGGVGVCVCVCVCV